jgi:multiple sugar transport system permease protein
MSVAPFMFLLILFLGRYMMRREDIAHSTEEDGRVWRALMFVMWPIRILVRGLMYVFWFLNGIGESIGSAVGQALKRGPSVPMSRAGKRKFGVGVMYALIGALILVEVAPFYFIFITSFKSTLQIQQIQNMFWPTPWTLEHFSFLFTRTEFPRWYLNTIVVAVVATAVSLFAASLGAYALVRLRWKGAGPMSSFVLVSYLIPTALLFIPLYAILVQLRLINTQGALMVTYPAIVLPFATWLMMGYYRSIPEELEDAALIDGCNRFQTYWMVVLPLVTPALLAVAMFAVTQAWNEYLLAKTFLRSNEVFTLPVGLGQLVVGDVQPWGQLMAASLLTAIPVVILYMLGQRFMVAGLTAGSDKG